MRCGCRRHPLCKTKSVSVQIQWSSGRHGRHNPWSRLSFEGRGVPRREAVAIGRGPARARSTGCLRVPPGDLRPSAPPHQPAKLPTLVSSPCRVSLPAHSSSLHTNMFVLSLPTCPAPVFQDPSLGSHRPLIPGPPRLLLSLSPSR